MPIEPLATKRPASLPSSSAARFLEGVDGRVVAEDVVADLGVGHRPAHGLRRMGDGVAAQIDRHGGRVYDRGMFRQLAAGIPSLARELRWLDADSAIGRTRIPCPHLLSFAVARTRGVAA